MLRYEDQERITFQELFSHQFFKKKLEIDLKKIQNKIKGGKDIIKRRAYSEEHKKNETEIENNQNFLEENEENIDMDQKFCNFLIEIRNSHKKKKKSEIFG